MSKKCKGCGAPIEGFWAKLSRIAGVKQSEKNPDYCNKCENNMEEKADQGKQVGQNPVAPAIPLGRTPEVKVEKPAEVVTAPVEPVVSADEEKQEEWAEELKEDQTEAKEVVEDVITEEEKK